MFSGTLLFCEFYADYLSPPSAVVQGVEEKDYFGVAQFVLGFPPSVEVQVFAELLEFQGHDEGVWPFRCRRLAVLNRMFARGWDFFWLVLVFGG